MDFFLNKTEIEKIFFRTSTGCHNKKYETAEMKNEVKVMPDACIKEIT